MCVHREGRDRKWTPLSYYLLGGETDGRFFNQLRVAALMHECQRRTFSCAARRSCARVKLKMAPLGFIGGSGGGFGGGRR